MKIHTRCIILIAAVSLSVGQAISAEQYRAETDSVTAKKIDRIIRSEVLPFRDEDRGEIISRVSSTFLNTPYRAGTLSAGGNRPEALVANFNGVDCFTLVDYVEALSRSRDEQSFFYHLAHIRYVNGQVSYLNRRHFFSDWFAIAPRNARDITPDISASYTTSQKWLNRRADGREYVPGLGIRPRKIHYLPGRAINEQVIQKLKNGDYVGIYSPLEGLDVSHVGIVVRHDGQVWFRDASSLATQRRVVDSPFIAYTRTKPGIVVLRAD